MQTSDRRDDGWGGEYCNQASPSGQLITANEHFDYLEGARGAQ